MNRNKVKLQTHRYTRHFSLNDKKYRACILKHTHDEMLADIGTGDITTDAFFIRNINASANVVAKETGIICGLMETQFFLKKMRAIKYNFLKKDGNYVKKGDKILRISGSIKELMKAERTILNFIGRMSGVAILANKYSKLARNVLIAPTRKTLWGLLDKKACTVGCGGTHRLGLDDAILIKHNHIKASGVDIGKYLDGSLINAKGRFIEIEVKNKADAIRAAEIFKQNHVKIPCVILLDNMKPREVAAVIGECKKNITYDHVLFEASGNINEKNIRAFAETGVDIISIGALTHSARSMDLTMRII